MAKPAADDKKKLELDGLNPEKVKEELLASYPTKVARKRAKQIIVNKIEPGEEVPVIQSNVRTVPGLISQRAVLDTLARQRGIGSDNTIHLVGLQRRGNQSQLLVIHVRSDLDRNRHIAPVKTRLSGLFGLEGIQQTVK